jgi:hypothetical protein
MPDLPQQQQPPIVSEQLLQAGTALNVPFTTAEIITALKRLRNAKSPGFTGICSEFFRYAKYTTSDADSRPSPHYVLADCLTRFMNAVFAHGVVPRQWDLSLITPVHKRGSAMNTANYHPIAVGEPLAKLYAVLVQLRLDSFFEEQRLHNVILRGVKGCVLRDTHTFVADVLTN